MSRNEILSILRKNKTNLWDKYPIQSLALFGSYARNEQQTESDIDILVDFKEAVGIEIVELALELDELLRTKVDLVSRKALENSPKFFHIQKDLLYV